MGDWIDTAPRIIGDDVLDLAIMISARQDQNERGTLSRLVVPA
jgi:hypothetical protein